MDIQTKSFCGSAGSAERTRFYPHQVITPADLTNDQAYFNEKLRRHNRMLHGWGIVCGAEVCFKKGSPCTVLITPGYVLGPQGHEIVIDRKVEIDVCTQRPENDCYSGCEPPDPWCADIPRPVTEEWMYIAVRYAECEVRPVRVHAGGCGCGSGDCQDSRIRESFAIGLLTELPETYDLSETKLASLFDKNKGGEFRTMVEAFMGKGSCPPCPTSPWVILGSFRSDGKQITTLDDTNYRRYLIPMAKINDLLYFAMQALRNQ